MSCARHVIAAICGLAPFTVELVSHAEKAWASATFDGAVHTVTLDFPGEQSALSGQVLAEQIGNIEFNIPGALVADARVLWSEMATVPARNLRLAIELLLVNHSPEGTAA